jgi:tRNA threonylcarbamoyladenosine biosynthesis protein TsaE
MAAEALVFDSESAERTEALAARLARELRPGDVVALSGELGAGKTCFVRGLARGLGLASRVTSPTFTLMHTYAGTPPLHHLDAWMQGRGEAFLSDGGAEWLASDGIAAVEWAERVAEWLPAARFDVRLEHAGNDRRRVSVAWTGEGDRLAAWRRELGRSGA